MLITGVLGAVKILYDPQARAEAQVGRRAAGTLVFAVIVFLLCPAVTTIPATLGLTGPPVAPHLTFPSPY